jgi:hypothetical protein
MKVYLQTIAADHSELVMTIDDDDVYEAITPALEAYARENRMFVTESMED